jgi:hypothetical protein
MKTKSRILAWLSSCILLGALTEIALVYNWRASLHTGDVDAVLARSHSEEVDTFVKVIYLTDPPQEASNWPTVSASAVDEVFPRITPEAVEELSRECCVVGSKSCIGLLGRLSVRMGDNQNLWVLYDSKCAQESLVVADNVGFTGKSIAGVIDNWRSNKIDVFSGPFKSDKGIGVIRFMLIESTTNGNRLNWNPEETFKGLRTFLVDLSPALEVIFDTQTVYSGEGDRLVENIKTVSDPYELSRLVNEEIEMWKGSPHLLEFGAYNMPPLTHVALVVGDADNGIYDIGEWGVVNFKQLSNLFACTNKSCTLSATGQEYMNNFVISLIRKWLGLSTGASNGPALSRVEKILLSQARKRKYLDSMAEDIRKQDRVLSALPRLAFPQTVADMIHESIEYAKESASTSNLTEGVIRAKLAATLAGEALHHESVMAAPSFSLEYLFALYAPIGLPLVFPVVMALIAHLKKKNS